MEAPEKRELMPLNIPCHRHIASDEISKKELTHGICKIPFIITGISKRAPIRCQLLPILMLKQLFPSPHLLDIDVLSLEHIYQS